MSTHKDGHVPLSDLEDVTHGCMEDLALMRRCGRADTGDGVGDNGRGGAGGMQVHSAVQTRPWRRRRAGGEPGTDGAEATLTRDVRRELMDVICGRARRGWGGLEDIGLVEMRHGEGRKAAIT
ncbi:hypothetical protein JB92DRAFT_2838893 [Gautieria morchelliformis]|nr:hypothetical protein JB92DRAFT_2838893 [Gautieria morchelliformis]